MPATRRGGAASIDEDCPGLVEPGRTMLGRAQERWLRAGLAAVPGRWNVIAQQTQMARSSVVVDGRRRVWTDAWDGYPAPRRSLLRFLRDSERAELRGHQRRQPRQLRQRPQARLRRRQAEPVADRALRHIDHPRPDGRRAPSRPSCATTRTSNTATAAAGATSSSTSRPSAPSRACASSTIPPTPAPASTPRSPSRSTRGAPARNGCRPRAARRPRTAAHHGTSKTAACSLLASCET